MTIFKLLRNESKIWWYHAQLRKNGDHKKAREMEHRSIRGTIASLRAAIESRGYASVGRGGYTLAYIPATTPGGPTYGRCRTEGYGNVSACLIQCAIKLGIPVYDSTTVSDENIYATLKFPMIGIGKEVDASPYSSLSYAPRKYVFELYEKIGATIYNKSNL